MRIASLCCACWVSIAAAAALAQESPIPATNAAAVARSTPTECLTSIATAVEKGNAEALAQCLLANDENEQRWVVALGELAAATAEFRSTITTRFTPDQTGQILAESTSLEAGLAAWQKASVTIHGSRAVVTRDGMTIELHRQPAGWVVPVTQLVDTKASIADVIAVMEKQSSGTRFTSQELKAGKYNTVQEAGQMLRKHILENLLPSSQPAERASAPTTQPKGSLH